MKMEIAKLRAYAEAARWPEGYLSDLLAASKVDGNEVEFDPSIHEALRTKYMAGPAPEPSLADLASNFLSATGRWAASGFPVVSEAEYAARAEACAACQFWDGKARFGLGKCSHPGCGCTRFKRWLRTEKCPMGKWSIYFA